MAYITLDQSSFFHNLDIITQRVKSKAQIALVLKDNAYGHGILEVAQMAKAYGITKAVVRCIHEARMIQDYFEMILILADFAEDKDFSYTINTLADIERLQKGQKVHIKVDTGMHRNGLGVDELDDAIALCEAKSLQIEAIFSHYRSADELSSDYFWQRKSFDTIKEKYHNRGYQFHIANSAALFRDNNFDDDMARIGIAAYGCLEMHPSFEMMGLKPILSLYATKIATKTLPKGASIGYGATFTCKQAMELSTYDIGYSDGFNRALSNQYVTPEEIPLLGRISMDSSSFASSKEELLIFNDARSVSKKLDTISYEVLVALKSYIQRIILE